jgi:NAD(P)-dependent dehydrogenase (short-subunit alcohol dehydrogenase family)
MRAIKEFRGECNRVLTSFRARVHRLRENETSPESTTQLFRRHGEEPDHHSEQDQRRQHGKAGVHWVKVKVRVATCTVSKGQHGVSLDAQSAHGNSLPLHFPTKSSPLLLFFLRLWYTSFMAEKVVLITGASSGIGLLTSVEMARAGFRVIATMRDLNRRARLDEAAAAVKTTAQIDVRALDVTNFDVLPGFVHTLVHDYGRIDALVNNAGFAVAGFAEDIRLEELRHQFETNFFGTVAMTKAVLPVMRQQRSGHIIQVSSIVGLHGAISVSSYSASKHAIEGWTESLRMEVSSLGIKVVLVEPGSFATDIWTRGAVMGQEVTKSSSPNFQRSLRMRDQIQKLPKADPIAVARLIVDVAQNPNPRLRYLVGRDAKIQLALKRMLPWKWHEKLIANFLKLDQEH